MEVAKASTSKDLSRRSIITLPFHASCAKCHHFFNHIRIDLPGGPGEKFDAICPVCQKIHFRLGGTSTQESLLSQETMLPTRNASRLSFSLSLFQSQMQYPPSASTRNLPSLSKPNHSATTIAGAFQVMPDSFNTGLDAFAGDLPTRPVRPNIQEALHAPLTPPSPEQPNASLTSPNNLRRIRGVLRRTIHSLRRPHFFAKRTASKRQTHHIPAQIPTNSDAVASSPRNQRPPSFHNNSRTLQSPLLSPLDSSTPADPTSLPTRVGKARREAWQPSAQGWGKRRLLSAKANLHASYCPCCQSGRPYDRFVSMRRCHTAPGRLNVSSSQLRPLEAVALPPTSDQDDNYRRISDTNDSEPVAPGIEVPGSQPSDSAASLSLTESATPRRLSPTELYHPRHMRTNSRPSISSINPPRLSTITTASDSSFPTDDPSGTPPAANPQSLMPPRLQTAFTEDSGQDDIDDENQRTPTQPSRHSPASPASPEDLQWVGQWHEGQSNL